jgi:5,10-methylene-tetrahydrofolate dehydrogenase/methenyl tetrahydrofolate cyclohydrolase
MKRVLTKGTLIDGNLMAAAVLDKLKICIASRPKGVPPPKLAIILAGNNHAS